MGVGGAIADIGVAEILGAVVETVPASDKVVTCATAGRDSVSNLKSHGVGQRDSCLALGAEVDHIGAAQACGAIGGDVDIVGSVGCKASE